MAGIATHSDNAQELFAVVDDNGHEIGRATRGECHSGSMLLHQVVHLQVVNSRGEIYLQQRPQWKDIQPGRWDTAVGGHVDYGEGRHEALIREAMEELTIDIDGEGLEPHFLGSYIFESSVEREHVSSYVLYYDGVITPTAELDGGAFWSVEKVERAIRDGAVLTENFIYEWQKFGTMIRALHEDDTVR